MAEKGKVSPIWRQLRLVMAHSTEVYIPLDINQSLFNAGLPIELREFGHQQVEDLAQLHGLNLNAHEDTTLMQMIGGHPYLIRLALYTLHTRDLTLEQLLDKASTESGIYSWDAAVQSGRAMALLWSFHPFCRKTQQQTGCLCPFEQLNGFRYHDNW